MKKFEPSSLSRHLGLRSRGRCALLLASAAFALLAIDVSAAFAQIETVVVTARKREENVQNIPVAVTAFSGAKLEHFDTTSLEKLATQTSQLIIARSGSGSGADISLRGIGSSFENIGIEQSVAVNVDGIYLGQGRAIDEGMFDLKQAEILKGPQALYFGKNATAGVISLSTNDPGDELEVMTRIGYEFYSETPSIEAVVSGPLTDTFGMRLAVRGSDMFGGLFTNNAPGGAPYFTIDYANASSYPGNISAHPTDTPERDTPRQKDGIARLTAKWQPTSDLTVSLKGTLNVYRTNNPTSNFVAFFCPLGAPQLDPAHPCGKNFVLQSNDIPADVAATDPVLNKRGGRAFEQYSSGTLIANVNYVQPNYTLSSATGYQRLVNDWANDEDFTATPLVYAGEHFVWRQFSTEERILTTFDFPLNFSGGFYYQSTNLDFHQDVVFFGSENSAAADPSDRFVSYRKLSGTAGSTYALFGQFIWDIMEHLQATVGGRYTHEIKNSFFEQPYVNPGTHATTAGCVSMCDSFVPMPFLFVQSPPAPPIRAHQDFDNFSPEAMLTWKPEENLTIYGGYKAGFKSGGFSDSAIYSTLGNRNDFIFRPEKAQGVEVGVKSSWFDDQLRADITLYNYLYKDLQVDFFNTPSFDYVTLNATSARTKGVELQAEYAPEDVKGLDIESTLAFNDSHYGRFIAPCSPAGLSFEQGCNFHRDPTTGTIEPAGTPDPSTGSFCDGSTSHPCDFMNINGAPTALAPKWTFTLGGDYNMPVGGGLKAGFSANARFSSSYVANGFANAITRMIDRQSAYATLDAAIRLGNEANTWQVAVIGRNLANAFIINSAQGLPLSGTGTGIKQASAAHLFSDQGGSISDPRTVAIQFTYRY